MQDESRLFQLFLGMDYKEKDPPKPPYVLSGSLTQLNHIKKIIPLSLKNQPTYL